MACSASGSKVESIQLKLDRNWSRESISSSGFNCSNCLAPVIDREYVSEFAYVASLCLVFVVSGTSWFF